MKFLVTEVCEYEVEGDSEPEARAMFEESGPEVSVESPVKFIGVTERTWMPAP